METIRTEHLSEAEIEDCARNKLRREDAEAIMSHFMNCDHCAALVEAEQTMRREFILAHEHAAAPAAEPRRKRSWPNIWTFPVPALATAVVGAVLFLGPQFHVPGGNLQTVSLTAYRGAPGTVASASAPLVLRLDATGLETQSGLQVQIVDETGRQVWQSRPDTEGLQFVAKVDRRLRSGVYWVRLVQPGDETPAREFRLQVN